MLRITRILHSLYKLLSSLSIECMAVFFAVFALRKTLRKSEKTLKKGKQWHNIWFDSRRWKSDKNCFRSWKSTYQNHTRNQKYFSFHFYGTVCKEWLKGLKSQAHATLFEKKRQNKGWVSLLKAFALRRQGYGKTKKWKMEIKVPLQKELQLIWIYLLKTVHFYHLWFLCTR